MPKARGPTESRPPQKASSSKLWVWLGHTACTSNRTVIARHNRSAHSSLIIFSLFLRSSLGSRCIQSDVCIKEDPAARMKHEFASPDTLPSQWAYRGIYSRDLVFKMRKKRFCSYGQAFVFFSVFFSPPFPFFLCRTKASYFHAKSFMW